MSMLLVLLKKRIRVVLGTLRLGFSFDYPENTQYMGVIW